MKRVYVDLICNTAFSQIYFVFEQGLIFTFKVHNIRAEAQGKQACSRQTLAVVVGSFEKKEPSLQKLLLNSLSKLIGLIAR